MPQTNTIKILIADDHPILRATLSNYLSQDAQIQVIGEVGETGSLVEHTRRLRPDLLLLDANMPGPSVVDVVKDLKIHHPQVQILVLTASKKRDQVLNLLRTGVRGYILKEDNPSELLQAIHTVAAGQEWFSPKIATLLVSSIRDKEQEALIDLTEREKDVVRLIVKGASNDEIAEQLFITTNTVKNHVRSIFRKLNVKTRVEAVLFVLQHHLLDDDESVQS